MMLTPAPWTPFWPGFPEASKHHREGCDAQVRLRLASAGREEEQVHGLTVRIERIREARQVQQHERELKRPPSGRVPIVELLAEALAQRARDGPVRHPKRIECVLVRRQQRDAALDPVRGVSGAEQQALRRIASSALKGLPSLRAALRSRRDTHRPAAATRPPRRHRRPMRRVSPLRARPPGRLSSRSSRQKRSGSTPCAAAGRRRRRCPSPPTPRDRWRARVYPRSGDRPPVRPSLRLARRAGPVSVRRRARPGLRFLPGRRMRGQGLSSSGSRRFTRKMETDRVPAGIPAIPAVSMGRTSTWSVRPPLSAMS